MEFFRHNTKINFMRLRKAAAIISILLFCLSIGSLIFNGLNWGLDFTGGTAVNFSFSKPVNLVQMRTVIKQHGFNDSQVQSYGSSQQVMVTLGFDKKATAGGKTQQQISKIQTAELQKLFPQGQVLSTDSMGAKVSHETANQGLLAVIVSLILISIYISFRFEYRMAISSAIALIHDPVLILGIFSFFHIEFDLTALAAVLNRDWLFVE